MGIQGKIAGVILHYIEYGIFGEGSQILTNQ